MDEDANVDRDFFDIFHTGAAEDGTPLATLREDPATLGKYTEVGTEGVDREIVPSMTAGVDVGGDAERERVVTEEPTNVDGEGTAHFLVTREDGRERCGSDGQDWPCDAYQELQEARRAQFGQTDLIPADGPITLDQVAQALGMPAKDLEARLQESLDVPLEELDGLRQSPAYRPMSEVDREFGERL